MKTLFLFLTAVVLSAGEPTKPGCCTPSQWEGLQAATMGIVDRGVPSIKNTMVQISYDEENGRIAYVTSERTSESEENYKIIYDYSRKVQFIIDIATQVCTVSQLTEPFTRSCLPEFAKPQGKFYYGIGDRTLPAESFTFNLNTTMVSVVLTDNCIPVAEVFQNGDAGGVSEMQSSGFINLSAGIKDPKVFIPPGTCTQVFRKDSEENFPKKRGIFTL